ncbi:MAG: helicase associated domain-containing protein [Bacteriovorax sp.]|jgi:hypothetical protein
MTNKVLNINSKMISHEDLKSSRQESKESAKNSIWENNFQKLQNFKIKNGHCNVPFSFQEDPSLASWVRKQRAHRRKLAKEHKEKLNQLGFSWRPLDDNWKKNFLKLKKFKKEFGHCNVPKSYSDYSLAIWIDTQRKYKNPLNPKRNKMLDEIGFLWKNSDIQWESNFLKLKSFKKKNGHQRVSKIKDPKLHNWMSTQKNKKDTLDLEKMKKLDDIGFAWKPYKNLWEQNFKLLLDFKNVHGHSNVPINSSNIELRNWVVHLRSKKKKLDRDLIQKLDSIGFDWSLYTQRWEDNFQKLIEFKKIHGHCKVPRIYPKDQSLAIWCNGLRLPNPGMSKQRRKRLTDIGFYEKNKAEELKKAA